jgi:peroxiredoxin
MRARAYEAASHSAAKAVWLAALAAAAAVLAPGAPAGASPSSAPPWLGVLISDGVRGVRVSEVITDAPADEAGLVAGDEIMAVAGDRVTTVAQLQAAVAGHRVGDTVVLGVWRNEGVLRRPVTLRPRLGAGEIFYRRLVGTPAPGGVAPVVYGDGSGRLQDLQGKVVVIAFFATECAECDPMHRRLSRLVDERGRDGLAVVAVSRESPAALSRWSQRIKPSFTVLQDRYGEFFRAFFVERAPAVVVVSLGGEVSYAGLGGEDAVDRAIFAAERSLRRGRGWWSR